MKYLWRCTLPHDLSLARHLAEDYVKAAVDESIRLFGATVDLKIYEVLVSAANRRTCVFICRR